MPVPVAPFVAAVQRKGQNAAAAYRAKILSYNPIAYWPLNETSGAVATCLVNAAQNGSYTGVTLANDETGGFATPAPYWDGLTDYANLYSAALASAFLGTKGTIALWVKLNAGWAALDTDRILRFYVNASNYILFTTTNVANQLNMQYMAGGTAKNCVDTALAGTGNWFHLALTYADANNGDAAIGYGNGAVWGAAQTGFGAWTGSIAADRAVLGALTPSSEITLNGWLAHVAAFNQVLTPAQILDLATV